MCSFAPISVSDIRRTGCVAALGCFDGLHIGHRILLTRAKKKAASKKLPLVIYSPESRKGQAFLTTPDEKRELLLSLGADLVILADFEKIKDLSPLAFVENILKAELNCLVAVCGYNFTFGKKAEGNAAMLTDLMAKSDRTVFVEASVETEGGPVSSTRIRSLLLQGNAEEASLLLDRPYSIKGHVIHGRAIGRTLGFPTLNLSFPKGKLIPQNGVYYCHVRTPIGVYGAISNIGIHPTFDDALSVPVLEAHLLGFAGTLYDREVTVELIRFMRPEKTFTDSTALAAAVHADIQNAKSLAANDPILSKEAL